MRRRDFSLGALLTIAGPSVKAQEPAKQNRIAIVISAGPAARIRDPGNRLWRAFFDELRRLGDVEGKNLVVEPYSGGGRPERYADLAREVVARGPDVIVASTDAIAQAARSANGTIPIVWVGGDPIQAGFATSLARPGGDITGVTVNAGLEIWGKRLQILKEAVPSASKIAFLNVRGGPIALDGPELVDACRRLGISLIDLLLQETAPAEFQRLFAQIAQERPDAIVVNSNGTLLPYRQLIVELVEKNRLPALYPWREYIEAGGLMAYEVDPSELGRRMADDVHEILNGAKPGDIPIYQPTTYELVINLKAAKALGVTMPPALLAAADEVIE
jgi:putative tryptophan/tyrosine transport system substrate-binding protein